MSHVYTERLMCRNTGASWSGGPQDLQTLSLGGLVATSPVAPFGVYRVNPLRGIRVVSAWGLIAGIYSLKAGTDYTLSFCGPSGSYGDSVAYSQDGFTVLYNGDKTCGCLVECKEYTPIAGVESIQLFPIANTAIGGSDFSNSDNTAGHAKYRGVWFQNDCATAAMSNFHVWIEQSSKLTTAIALETVTANAIQTIASETTAPTGRAFASPAEGDTFGSTITSKASGEGFGLWIRRTITTGAECTPRDAVTIHVTYDIAGGGSRHDVWKGLFSIAKTVAAPYELYAKIGSAPDPAVDSPIATDADGSFSITPAFAGGTWYLQFFQRNIHGLLSPTSDTQMLRISSGAVLPGPPVGPSAVSVVPISGGLFAVSAKYLPIQETDITLRATEWHIYTRYDGTDPVPATDTPAIVAMNTEMDGRPEAVLYETTSAQLDETPVRVLVRTARTNEDTTVTESENTAAIGATTVSVGAGRPRGVSVIGTASRATTPEDIGTVTTVIDAGTNTRWIAKVADMQLWTGTQLIWRIRSNDSAHTFYVPTENTLVSETVTGTGNSEPVQVSGGHVYFNVNGHRFADYSTSTREFKTAAWWFSESLSEHKTDGPTLSRYADTLFTAYDAEPAADYVPHAQLNASGSLQLSAEVDHTLTQSAIGAL